MSFSNKCNFKRHVSSVHKGKKPYQCDMCDASFAQKQQLQIHIASVHERKKPYNCDMCDAKKRFAGTSWISS